MGRWARGRLRHTRADVDVAVHHRGRFVCVLLGEEEQPWEGRREGRGG